MNTNIMNTPPPTPETDAATFKILSSLQSGTEKVVYAEICAKLERDEAREQLKAMKEAIKDAHYALDYVYNHGEGSCAFPFRTNDDLCSENRFHRVKDALNALKPFIKL